jgi:single-stranded-DNA-specific exonuclease
VLPDPAPAAPALARDLSLPLPVAQLLVRRGHHTADAARAFLQPVLRALGDPFDLPDMRRAVERIWDAVRSGEVIALYGDYDVDGITSIALLTRVLTALGARVHPFLPLRLAEGYGLSIEALERCISEIRPGLIVAVDCGTTSVDEARWLAERRVDLVIADHHELGPERPPCLALVNPKCGTTCHYLCSAGLAFKLAHALLKHIETRDIDLRDYLDLVALGTVADIVPLVEDNRALVRSGLERMAVTHNTGLRELMAVTRVTGVPATADVGFRLGPRLNAAGRLGDAMMALELLLTDDPVLARSHAATLDQRNRERQEIERATLDEAMAQVESEFDPDRTHAIVVGRRGWHAGVIGIVASRIQRHFWRPTFVVAIGDDGVGKGSGRSVEGCHLIDGLRACAPHLLQFGGHSMAAGLNVREEQLPDFAEAFNAWGATQLTGDLRVMPVRPDAVVRLPELDLDFVTHLETLRPFGAANPEPLFYASRVRVARPPQHVGRNHLRLRLEQDGATHDAIAFNRADEGIPGDLVDLAFVPERDDFRGGGRIQIRVIDVRRSV